ncbi:MAG: sugar transferase [Bacteroidetes bacterium]|nr:MAG: sugar transferase [Bacteroidota bacterium]
MGYNSIKRAGDILFAMVGIMIFLPFFIPLAIALKLTGEGYIFYLQERRGYKNRMFKIWKFATMLKASPGLGTGSITVRNDWRLTPMGKYLRGSKVNEIPQLINILLGEMSVVGPRPLMEADFVKFSPEIQDHFYDCKPGLTGIASIVFRDEEKLHSESGMDPHEFDRLHLAPYKGALELWYHDHMSLRTDFLIILLTAIVIVLPENQLAFRLFKDLPARPDFWK